MEEEKRDVSVHFWVTKSERQWINDNMKRTGIIVLGAYLRKMALNGYIINLELTTVKELIRVLRITSDNINQIAKRANATGNIYHADIVEMQKRYDKLWDVAGIVMDTMGELL